MNQVFLAFDLSDDADKIAFDKVMADRRQRAMGVPDSFVQHIKHTRTGSEFVQPVAKLIKAGDGYSVAELASLIGMNAGQVASRLRLLGRTEKSYGVRIFERRDGKYVMTPGMKRALSAA